MKLKRLLVAVTLIILVGGGGLAYRQSLNPATEGDRVELALPAFAAAATAVNRRGDGVSSEGELVPIRHVALSFQNGGAVARLLVAEGDRVEADQPLIQLEAAEAQAALAQAEAGLAQAEASELAAATQVTAAQIAVNVAEIGVAAAKAHLALLQAGPLPEEIAVLEATIGAASAAVSQAAGQRDVALTGATSAQLAAAEAQVAAALAEKRIIQDQYDNLLQNEVYGTPEEQLRFALNAAEASLAAANAAVAQLRQGPTTAQRVAAQSGVAVASAQGEVAQAQLNLLLAGTRAEQITIAEVAVSQAEILVAQAQVTVEQAEAAVRQAEMAVRQAAASRDAAQALLDKMTLRAPFAGSVVFLPVEAGQVVQPGSVVATIADLTAWQVETTDLTELNVVAVKVGLPASISIDALPEVLLRGHVADVAAVSTVVRGDVTYKVTIRLDEIPDLPLRWGMTTYVNVHTTQ
jgi:multidrug resistance efflux pump